MFRETSRKKTGLFNVSRFEKKKNNNGEEERGLNDYVETKEECQLGEKK